MPSVPGYSTLTDLSNPGPIGGTTPNSATFTTVVASGLVTFQSAQAWHPRVYTSGTSTSLGSTDLVIIINKATGSATAVSLPAAPVTGRIAIIKDGKGDAATNNITITPGGGNIDGAATYVINTARGAVFLIWDGTNWDIISKINT